MKLLYPAGRSIYIFVIIAMLFITGNVSGQLLLNEMMSSNITVLEDQFNEFPDWIEIYNSGDSALDLQNYRLSDDSTLLNKWTLPSIRLTGGSYLLVFASGKDISSRLVYWHTLINVGDEWRYHLPDEAVDDAWKVSSQFSSAWDTGESGFGYSDDDDSTEIPQTISLFMQKEFQLGSIDQIADAALFMDYDDGFIAYLNGVEIARSKTMGDSGSVVSYNAPAGGNHEANMYNGSPPEAYYFSKRLDLLQEGSNMLAIEVHNVSNSSSDMSAIPFLLLGYKSIQDSLIYRNPFFDVKEIYPHTNFKIKSSGEAVFLSDSAGTVIDRISNIQLPADYSYGRIPGDTVNFAYYDIPTPGEINGTVYYTAFISDSVQIVSSGMDYDPTQRIHVESQYGDDDIRFTIDGSDPDRNSPLFSGFMDLDETRVVKARIYRGNSLPGPVTTKTFFIGESHELPVISVSMNPYDLWDENNGMYVLGPHAEEKNPHLGANFWQPWEKPAYIEIYNEAHELVLAQNAGTKIFGGWSRAHPQKSMSFFARSKYGDGNFSYPLFSERNFDRYESFVLRNDGNDWCNGNFRDALSAYMSGIMDIDHQAYQPYVMYLNGDYWGFINMREKVNEHFIASNHNVYADDVNILIGDRGLVTGNGESYMQLYDYITNTDLSGEEEYKVARTMMDVQNYMRFWVLNVYIDNKDWPGNNIKYWSTNAPGSKYRWISYDTDFGYSIWDQQAYQYNTLLFSFGEGPDQTWANKDWAVAIINSLVGNDTFRRQFINEFADRMNTTFLPETMIPVIDSFEQRLLNEAPAHYDRWITDPGSWLSFDNWILSVERMRTYFRERPQYMRQQLMDRFNISGTSEIVINVSDSVAGYVHLNSIDLHSYPFTGDYFNNIPINLKAVPAPGYVFSHWEGGFSADSSAFLYEMDGPAEFVAVFEAVDSLPDIVINEINYASADQGDTDDWIELYNNSGVSVDLTGWSIGDSFSEDTFYIPAETILPADGYIVVSKNRPDFKKILPEFKNLIGDLPFGLDKEGDGIALYDQEGELHDYVIYKSESPWPLVPDGAGLTLELINPKLDNSLAKSWKASIDTLGTPFALNSRYEEVLTGTDSGSGKVNPERFTASVYPSPFIEQTNIRFTSDHTEKVIVSVFSVTGSLVEILANQEFIQGEHTIKWIPDAKIPVGLYLINIRTATHKRTLKVVYQ